MREEKSGIVLESSIKARRRGRFVNGAGLISMPTGDAEAG